MARHQAVSRPSLRPLPLLALLLICAAQQARACTQIIMGGPKAAFPSAYPDQVLSARNMGFFVPENLGFDLVAVPKGLRVAQMPLGNDSAPLYAPEPVKFAFLCVGSRTKDLGAAVAKLSGDPKVAAAYPGICADGLNTAGLSAAWLWDSNNAIGSAPRTAKPAPPAGVERITYLDLTARVLGQCDTIACARAAMSKLAAVNSPVAKAIAAGVIGGGYDFVAVHGTFCDRSGRCIGVEWSKPGAASVYDLPQSTFTNEPGVPEQVKLYTRYMAASKAQFAADGAAMQLANWPGGIMQYRPANLSAGASEPAARYTRMAMMMQLYGPVAWPTPKNTLSPGHYGSKVAAMTLISTIINYSAEAGAAPDTISTYQWPGQMSHFISTRDHLAGDYYLRTSFNMNQHRFNVAKLATGTTVKVADFAALMPATEYAKDMKF